MAGPLSPQERDRLLAALGQRVGRTAKGFARGMTWVSALFFAMALVCGFAKGQWDIAAFVGGFGILMVAIGVVAVRRTSPERMAPVLEALREAPGRVSLVRHYETSDSQRMFVSHWIEVKTATHRLVIKANQDWRELLDLLARLCPQAERKDR